MKKIFFTFMIALMLFMTSCGSDLSDTVSDHVSVCSSSDQTLMVGINDDSQKDSPASTPQTETETSSENFSADPSDVRKSPGTGAADKTSSVPAESESQETKPVKKVDPIQKPNSDMKSKPEIPEQKSSEPKIIFAGEKDNDFIADKIIEYINEYRNQNGACSLSKLPGMTQLAKFRSEQLVTNFAHDTDDIRTAAAMLKYGEYIDPKLYGADFEPYYCPDGMEAIAMSGYIGTVDDVAGNFASMTKNSPSHWSYVGSAKYKFAGVGVTYASGLWYMNITVSDTDQYEIKTDKN